MRHNNEKYWHAFDFLFILMSLEIMHLDHEVIDNIENMALKISDKTKKRSSFENDK